MTITLTTNFISSSGQVLKANTPIGIVGTAASGTNDTILRVRSFSDIAQFGDPAVGTIVKALTILQKYGCNNIFVIKVATGANTAATIVNLVGTETSSAKTGLPLFKDAYTQFQDRPELIIVPGFLDDTLVAQALAVAGSPTVRALYLVDFPLGSTYATVATTRATTTGLGTKNNRMVPCCPFVKNGANYESPSTHLAGVIAKTTLELGFGYTPSNKQYYNIDGTEPGFTFSYSDVNADNIKLEKLGVFSTSVNSYGLVTWGNRNASYVLGTTETPDTYITMLRIRQVLDTKFLDVIKHYIDLPCNFSTAKALERALSNIIDDNYVGGALKSSYAMFNESKSSYAQRSLYYDIVITSTLPTGDVTANIQYSIVV